MDVIPEIPKRRPGRPKKVKTEREIELENKLEQWRKTRSIQEELWAKKAKNETMKAWQKDNPEKANRYHMEFYQRRKRLLEERAEIIENQKTYIKELENKIKDLEERIEELSI